MRAISNAILSHRARFFRQVVGGFILASSSWGIFNRTGMAQSIHMVAFIGTLGILFLSYQFARENDLRFGE